MLRMHGRLRFTPAIEAASRPAPCGNPKRLQREIRRQQQAPVTGTKSQQALALLREQSKAERKTRTREQWEEEKALRFA